MQTRSPTLNRSQGAQWRQCKNYPHLRPSWAGLWDGDRFIALLTERSASEEEYAARRTRVENVAYSRNGHDVGQAIQLRSDCSIGCNPHEVTGVGALLVSIDSRCPDGSIVRCRHQVAHSSTSTDDVIFPKHDQGRPGSGALEANVEGRIAGGRQRVGVLCGTGRRGCPATTMFESVLSEDGSIHITFVRAAFRGGDPKGS